MFGNIWLKEYLTVTQNESSVSADINDIEIKAAFETSPYHIENPDPSLTSEPMEISI